MPSMRDCSSAFVLPDHAGSTSFMTYAACLYDTYILPCQPAVVAMPTARTDCSVHAVTGCHAASHIAKQGPCAALHVHLIQVTWAVSMPR